MTLRYWIRAPSKSKLVGRGAGWGAGRDRDGREHRRIFSAGRDPKFLVLMDADNGKSSSRCPSARAWMPISSSLRQTCYIYHRAGKIHIFHEDSPTSSPKLKPSNRVRSQNMGFDPKTHNLFLTTADFRPLPPQARKNPIRSESRSLERFAS